MPCFSPGRYERELNGFQMISIPNKKMSPVTKSLLTDLESVAISAANCNVGAPHAKPDYLPKSRLQADMPRALKGLCGIKLSPLSYVHQ